MAEQEGVRHRGGGVADPNDEEDAVLGEENENNEEVVGNLPQATDDTIPLIDRFLSGFSARWRNWIIRGLFSVVMIGVFGWVISKGPLALMVTVLAIQIRCFWEIISIGHAVYRVHDLPWFRTLSWYLLLCSNYYICGEYLIDCIGIALRKDEFLHFLVVHHRFISYTMYIGAFIWFVLSLQKGYYMRQFSVFALTHVTLVLIVLQSFAIISNLFEGIIWFLVPVSMIICNDIMAYMFGFFFGKTKLIDLSPKKTWEGFLGGGVSTVVIGIIMGHYLCKYPFFVCPVEYSEASESFTSDCIISPTFLQRDFLVPSPLSVVFKLCGRSPVIRMYPFLIHAGFLGMFAAVMGPFGGFFASGFKRAFKIKDFGDVIPGHGGLMDRFDCQLLMGSFVYVYLLTFVKVLNPLKIIQHILFLKPEEQLEVYNLLTEKLKQSGILA